MIVNLGVASIRFGRLPLAAYLTRNGCGRKEEARETFFLDTPRTSENTASDSRRFCPMPLTFMISSGLAPALRRGLSFWQPNVISIHPKKQPTQKTRDRRAIMTLTKETLIQSLQDQVGLSKKQSRVLVDNFFELLKKRLQSGEDILISGFGKFIVKEKAQRRGRNPATGRDLNLNARRVVTFKCSPVLRDRINENWRLTH